MNEAIKIAYAEVDTILDLMEDEYKNKIPLKLRQLIKLNKLENYSVTINTNIPLENQHISKKALAILAVLNYNYWASQLEKEELIKTYNNNQKKLQKEYDVNKIFKNNNKKNNIISNCNNNLNTQIILYKPKENFITKIINKIKNMIFNKNN